MSNSDVDTGNVQLHEMASDSYSGDKQNLIQNGQTGTGSSHPAHDASPLHVDAADEKLAREKKKTTQGLQIIVASSVVFAVSVTIALIITIYCAPPQVTPHGAVATDDSRCSQIGADMMQKHDGSAMDGAIAAMFCLSVVQPESSGVGGGGFLINREHSKKTSTVINFRETAPENVNPMRIVNVKGDGSIVGVPGALKGYFEAHKQFGKVKWDTLIQPSVELARDGYKLGRHAADKIHKYIDCSTDVKLAEVYCKNGKHKTEGETVQLKQYADFLENLGRNGIVAFYEGDVADEIIETVKGAGGDMTKRDLNTYEVETTKPIVSSFHGMTIETVPPPGGGVFALAVLNVLDLFKYKKNNKTELYHYLIEVQKFALAMGETLGDPDFNGDTNKLVKKYIGKEFAQQLFDTINPNHTLPEARYKDFFDTYTSPTPTKTHTTHVSVIGTNEDHVSITGSLNFNFGSFLMTPRSGIILNNHLADFSNDTNSPNYVEAGKRPLSHISPVVAHSQDRPCGLRLAAGAAGSQLIPSLVSMVMMNVLKLDMDLTKAVLEPRVLALNLTDVEYEDDLAAGVLDGLKQKGHALKSIPALSEAGGIVDAVMKINETLSAAADQRRADKPGQSTEIVF